MDSVVFYVIALALFGLSLVKSRAKSMLALKKAWKAFENILPQFLVVMVLVAIVLAVFDAKLISKLIGKDSGAFGVILAALVGSITLIPGFVAFPAASALLQSGAGVVQIAAFVSTLMMVGLVTLPMEMKYFGRRAAIMRNALAFVLSFGIAAIVGLVVAA
jgi:uncharacterized membrane protein YraQ (UPF0718 family)